MIDISLCLDSAFLFLLHCFLICLVSYIIKKSVAGTNFIE